MTDRTKPQISVIIPVYNAETYLRECLDSVVNQTLREIEIICVDDGSTDDSLEILREYEKKDARVTIITQPNSGVSAARNLGILAASGEYLTFVDSDDYVDPDTYKTAYTTAKNESADIVVFGGSCFPPLDWADECLSPKKTIYRHDSFNALFGERGSRPFPVNKIYRSNLFSGNGVLFDETLKLGEDHALMFDIFPLADTIVYIDDKFYHYRQNSASAMAGYNADIDKKEHLHLDIVRHVFREWKEREYTKKHGNSLAAWIISFLANDLKKCSYNFKLSAYREVVDLVDDLTDSGQLPEGQKNAYKYMRKQLDEPYVPRVSIIMLVLDAEESLPKTLQSLSAQSCLNYELLFVDSGSTDRSVDIIRRFVESDSRARLLPQQHQDAGAARNYGMQHAHGEYLLFLDANDLFRPLMIEKILDRADETKADICVFSANRYNKKNGSKSPMKWTCDPDLCPSDMDTFSRDTSIDNIFLFTNPESWNKLFRKSFIESNMLMFRTECTARDMMFVMTALAAADRISVCDEVLMTRCECGPHSLQRSSLLEIKKALIERNLYTEVEPAFIRFAVEYWIQTLIGRNAMQKIKKAFPTRRNLDKVIKSCREYGLLYTLERIESILRISKKNDTVRKSK